LSSIWQARGVAMAFIGDKMGFVASQAVNVVKGLWGMTVAMFNFGRTAVMSTGLAIKGVVDYIISLWATRTPLLTMRLMASVAWAKSLDWIRNSIKGVIGYIATLWATRPPMLVMLTNVRTAMIDTAKWLGSAIMGPLRYAGTMLTSAIPALVAWVTTLNFAAIGQTLLNTLMLANPVGLIIAGVLGLMAVFYALFKIIDTLFPGFFDGVKEWFGKAWDFIYKWFIEPIAKAFSWLFDLSSLTGAMDATATIKTDDSALNDLMKSMGLAEGGGIGSKGLGKGGKMGDLGLGQKMDNNVSGDKGVMKNITISINSLVKEMNFTEVKDIGSLKSSINKAVIEVLMTAVNEANHAM
jgi:hypothetical protein